MDFNSFYLLENYWKKFLFVALSWDILNLSKPLKGDLFASDKHTSFRSFVGLYV